MSKLTERSLNQAIDKAGGVLEFVARVNAHRRTKAAKMKVSRFMVWRWRQKGRVPAEFVLTVEDITGVSRVRLRPDLYPG